MKASQSHFPRLASLAAPLFLASCAALSGPTAPMPSPYALLEREDAAPSDDGETESLFEEFVVEIGATLRDGADDDVYGIGIYAYPEEGFGLGFQVQSTVRQVSPELEVVLTPPSGELPRRTRELTFDVVGTRRLSPSIGIFAGVGIATLEEYRRFIDAVGNDFFVRDDRDIRGNVTAGVHVWLAESLTLSAQWDSIFEATTFAIGWEF